MDPQKRGSHVAYSHPLAEKIAQALIAKGVVIDYRRPELIRFGIAPLYLDSQDIAQAVQIVSEVVKSLR
jgi:kynureninase